MRHFRRAAWIADLRPARAYCGALAGPEECMNVREPLQFLALMAPTLLLVVLLAVTLA